MQSNFCLDFPFPKMVQFRATRLRHTVHILYVAMGGDPSQKYVWRATCKNCACQTTSLATSNASQALRQVDAMPTAPPSRITLHVLFSAQYMVMYRDITTDVSNNI